MTSALAWLNHVMVWLGSWIPRLLVVLKTERGIRYRNGSEVRILEPGRRIYWPLVTKVHVVNVMRQVLNLSTQTLTTLDGKAVIASGVLVYRIVDVEKYLVDNNDADAGIDEVTCAAVRDVLIGLSLAEIQAARKGHALDQQLGKRARKFLSPFGVRVEYCRLTDFAASNVLSVQGIPNDLHLTQYTGARGEAA